MKRELVVNSSVINDFSDCYVIAEIGHNHQGELEQARQLFDAAKQAGANAVKLQKRHNRTLYTKQMFEKPYENRNSYGTTYGMHREHLEFGWHQYTELYAYADELGLDFFATAFDMKSAEFLQKLDVPAFKIASGDLKTTPLLKYVASFGKPMFVSTGAGSMDDVRRARDAIMPINDQLCILQCTAGYPPAWDELNLGVIQTFRAEFPDNVIGFSSHDSGIAMASAAYAIGARVIEKHFTLNRALKGTDHSFSLEPAGLTKMVRDLRRLKVAMGDGEKIQYESEVGPAQKMGKSLVAARDLADGTILSIDDISMRSPGGGLPPYELDKIVGMRLKRPIRDEEQIELEMLETLKSA